MRILDFLGYEIEYLEYCGEKYFIFKHILGAIFGDSVKGREGNYYKRIPQKYLRKEPIKTKYGTKDTNLISEPGFYYLILIANIPQSEKLLEWLLEEVTPKIVNDGTYGVLQQAREETNELPEGEAFKQLSSQLEEANKRADQAEEKLKETEEHLEGEFRQNNNVWAERNKYKYELEQLKEKYREDLLRCKEEGGHLRSQAEIAKYQFDQIYYLLDSCQQERDFLFTLPQIAAFGWGITNYEETKLFVSALITTDVLQPSGFPPEKAMGKTQFFVWLPQEYSEGKFRNVLFATAKGAKLCLQALRDFDLYSSHNKKLAASLEIWR